MLTRVVLFHIRLASAVPAARKLEASSRSSYVLPFARARNASGTIHVRALYGRRQKREADGSRERIRAGFAPRFRVHMVLELLGVSLLVLSRVCRLFLKATPAAEAQGFLRWGSAIDSYSDLGPSHAYSSYASSPLAASTSTTFASLLPLPLQHRSPRARARSYARSHWITFQHRSTTRSFPFPTHRPDSILTLSI